MITVASIASMFFLNFEKPHLLVCSVSVCWVIVAMDFLLLKSIEKSLSQYIGMRQEFVFADYEMSETTSSEKFNGTSRLKYSAVHKVMETSKYFFVYQTDNSVYIVDKSTLSGGTVEELRAKLSPAVKKYVVCKY